eukprot:TRINITY_DN6612_c0_g1_i1.p1 TRINITY_DN6612_c0_g1~~TRINITY_DN6612_c0_g1_i1.p1  ORF type:complete len:315 (+),score=40.87 TRINITY_DN6612_c0_g1_i1:141-1085(+)
MSITKKKKYRLRLCVDTTALRSWIVHCLVKLHNCRSAPPNRAIPSPIPSATAYLRFSTIGPFNTTTTTTSSTTKSTKVLSKVSLLPEESQPVEKSSHQVVNTKPKDCRFTPSTTIQSPPFPPYRPKHEKKEEILLSLVSKDAKKVATETFKKIQKQKVLPLLLEKRTVERRRPSLETESKKVVADKWKKLPMHKAKSETITPPTDKLTKKPMWTLPPSASSWKAVSQRKSIPNAKSVSQRKAFEPLSLPKAKTIRSARPLVPQKLVNKKAEPLCQKPTIKPMRPSIIPAKNSALTATKTCKLKKNASESTWPLV